MSFGWIGEPMTVSMRDTRLEVCSKEIETVVTISRIERLSGMIENWDEWRQSYQALS